MSFRRDRSPATVILVSPPAELPRIARMDGSAQSAVQAAYGVYVIALLKRSIVVVPELQGIRVSIRRS